MPQVTITITDTESDELHVRCEFGKEGFTTLSPAHCAAIDVLQHIRTKDVEGVSE